MKLVISNAAVENGNRGCVALSLSVMYLLKKLLQSRGIECEFILPNSGHLETGHYMFRSGGVELAYYAMPNIASTDKISLLKALYNASRSFDALRLYRQANAVLDIGVGDSFSDIYGLRRFNNIFSQYRLAMLFHKPFCILPQTIGPFHNPSVRRRAVRGIRYAKIVMTRDKQSQEYVSQIAPNVKATECIDVAFFMPYEQQSFQQGYVHVGLNVSALLWNGGYTRNNQFGLSCDYQSLVKHIIGYFLSLEHVKLHLIPHVVGGERHIENDYAVCYDLWKESNDINLILAPLFLDPIAAKSYISGLDFFMGARMHSTIAAFSSGVPVVPMAYSRKFNGLFVDTLGYANLVDMKICSNDEALQIIKDSFLQRSERKEYIRNQMETTVKEKEQILNVQLATFLGV